MSRVREQIPIGCSWNQCMVKEKIPIGCSQNQKILPLCTLPLSKEQIPICATFEWNKSSSRHDRKSSLTFLLRDDSRLPFVSAFLGISCYLPFFRDSASSFSSIINAMKGQGNLLDLEKRRVKFPGWRRLQQPVGWFAKTIEKSPALRTHKILQLYLWAQNGKVRFSRFNWQPHPIRVSNTTTWLTSVLSVASVTLDPCQEYLTESLVILQRHRCHCNQFARLNDVWDAEGLPCYSELLEVHQSSKEFLGD